MVDGWRSAISPILIKRQKRDYAHTLKTHVVSSQIECRALGSGPNRGGKSADDHGLVFG